MRHSTRRALATGAFALSAALLLAGCSGGGDSPDASGDPDSGELTPVKLQLQWLPQAQFAGYFAAIDQGYFEEEGLEVEIIPSGGDIVPQDALANGDVDFAIAWVPKVLGSIEAGANLTDIAQIFQRSGTFQVSWADSGIESVADFEGMVAFLKEQRIALQYIPERLIVREAMPATPTGKVQKFKLREMLSDGSI